MSKSPKTWYGDVDGPVEELLYQDGSGKQEQERPNGPENGDELCDGHQAHYEWKDGKWR